MATKTKCILLKTSIASKRARVEERLDETLEAMGWIVSPAAAAAAAVVSTNGSYRSSAYGSNATISDSAAHTGGSDGVPAVSGALAPASAGPAPRLETKRAKRKASLQSGPGSSARSEHPNI